MQGDDMPDVPPETVTEQEYVDENGHTVVRKVMSPRPPGATPPVSPHPQACRSKTRNLSATVPSRSPGRSSGGTCPLMA